MTGRLPTDQFRAERLSMWLPYTGEEVVFDREHWETLTDTYSMPAADLAIGVDAAPGRDTATVCGGAVPTAVCISTGTQQDRVSSGYRDGLMRV